MNSKTLGNGQHPTIYVFTAAVAVASFATLKLLAQLIEETQAIADTGKASIQEVKRNWNLL